MVVSLSGLVTTEAENGFGKEVFLFLMTGDEL
jgi:hypothetical protein